MFFDISDNIGVSLPNLWYNRLELSTQIVSTLSSQRRMATQYVDTAE